MKVVIPGGSGQVGTILTRAMIADGHEVIILSRRPGKAIGKVFEWDTENLGPWAKEIDGSDVIVNLAGRTVNCRYNSANRGEILDSRVRSTTILGKAIENSTKPPRVWLQSSTATIYAHRFEAPNDESSGILGTSEDDVPETWRFSTGVARVWEEAANDAVVPQTRKVLLRSAITLSPDPGGVFDVLLGLVRHGLGGTNGDGKQFVSWIHDVDFVRAVYWLIDHELEGAVNLASPNPLPNEEFMRTLRQAWGTKLGLPATRWMLEVGAALLQTETELILKSRRVIPSRLLDSGYEFRFPYWPDAANDLCRRWRELTRRVTITADSRNL